MGNCCETVLSAVVPSIVLKQRISAIKAAREAHRAYQEARNEEDEDDQQADDDEPEKPGCCQMFWGWFFPRCCYDYWKYQRDRKKRPPTNFCARLCTDGTVENECFKRLSFMLMSMFVTLYLFLYILMRFPVLPELVGTYTGMTCIVFATFACWWIAFRCFLVLFSMDIFCSRGRYVMAAAVILLVLHGPYQNITDNLQVTAKVAGCIQEQVKADVKQTLRSLKEPLKELIKPFYGMVEDIKRMVVKVVDMMQKVGKVLTKIFDAIEEATKWLDIITDACNSDSMNPTQKCLKAIDAQVEECHAKHDSWFMWGVCKLPRVLTPYCYITPLVRLLCYLPNAVEEFLTKHIFDRIQNAIDAVMTKVKNALRVKFKASYKTHYNITVERHLGEMKHALREFVEQYKISLHLANLGSAISLTFFLAWAVWSAIYYMIMWNKVEFYDNHFQTFELTEVDDVRREKELPTVHPLSIYELNYYISIWWPNLLNREIFNLLTGLILNGLFTIYVVLFVLADIAVYELLGTLIKSLTSKVNLGNIAPFPGAHITGNGAIANAYRKIIQALSPAFNETASATKWQHCLSLPSEPDSEVRNAMLYILAACYVSCFLEIALKRWRHVVCSDYFPIVARRRALWLHAQIMELRNGSFAYMMKTKVKQRDYDVVDVDAAVQRIRYEIPAAGFLMNIVGLKNQQCVNCGTTGKYPDSANFLKCGGCELGGNSSTYCITCARPGKQCGICNAFINLIANSAAEVEDSSTDDGEDFIDPEPEDY